jgi:mRNA interferase MazF
MIFERFDVVVVPFPFVDSPRTKPRPALVLSVADFNRANGHAVLAMITRATHTRWPSDHPVMELSTTGLNYPSVVRWKVFTLDDRVIQRAIGVLGVSDAEHCLAHLARWLGLTR